MKRTTLPLAGTLLAALALSLPLGRAQSSTGSNTSGAAASANPPAAATPGPGGTSPVNTNPDQAVQLNQYVVVGDRASVASALEIKRNSGQIVDSIVADDINKLPDTNTAEALERISGIQVGVNTGEIGGNGGLAIRGLTQIENTIDGREVFTAGGTATGGVGAGTRTYDYSDLPSALVGGIDVYKTSAADQPEGGLGGLINVRLHKPFDFPAGFTGAVTVGTTYNNQYQEDKPNSNVLVSDWMKTGIGKIGVLIDYSYTALPFREDNISVGNPIATPAGFVTGGAANAAVFPSGVLTDTAQGTHQHTGVNAQIQWQAGEHLQIYTGGNYQQYWIREVQYELSMAVSAAQAIPGTAVLFPGSSTDVESGSFSNVTGSNFGVIRDVSHTERQYDVGAIWNSDALTLNLDVSRDNFAYGFFNNAVYGSVVVPTFTYNVASAIPTAFVSGASLLDPSIYKYTQVYNRLYPSTGYQTSGTLDGEYKFSGGPITSVKVGLRYAGTVDDNGTTGLYLGSYNIPASQQAYGTFPGQYMFNPVQNFFNGYHNQTLSQYLTPLTTNLRNAPALLATYGDTTTTAQNDGTVNPLSLYHLDEGVGDVYVMPKFSFTAWRLPIDGNFGVRFAHTEEQANGFQTIVATATTASYIAPLSSTTTYNDVLPSFNARVKLTDTLFLRVAASKTLTRPQFSQLSPSLTLNSNPINPSLNTGSAGNPNLKPDRADNYDFSVEKYFSRDTSVYLAGFYKSVDGFPLNVADTETYSGLSYQVTRPVNLNTATVKGAEIGYTQFFDFLPKPLDGLGFQGNFTYVQSRTPSSILSYSASLPALSRDSYNAILMYEKAFFSARLAYNWRSKYFNSVATYVGIPGVTPNFTKQYGELDGSLNFNFTKNLTLHLDAQNLTNTLRETYYGTLTRPNQFYLDGVNFLASLTLKL